jgi:hypothetical protein
VIQVPEQLTSSSWMAVFTNAAADKAVTGLWPGDDAVDVHCYMCPFSRIESQRKVDPVGLLRWIHDKEQEPIMQINYLGHNSM